MCARALPPHRFVCLTDQAFHLPSSIDTIEVAPPAGAFAWWTKVQLFNPALPLRGRVLYLDLDVLLVGDMGAIIDYPAPLAFAPDGAPNFRPSDGRQCVKRFNSSVIAWDAGTAPELYVEWVPSLAKRLWGDQDWFGQRRPDAAAMPAEWFPRLSALDGPTWGPEARVVLCKKPKNADAALKFPWFNEVWQ